MFLLAMPDPRDPPPRPPRRARGWIWFFVILGVLATAAIVIEVWFNAGQQLTPERVAEARAKWNAKGPVSYHLEYRLKSVGNEYKYEVEVRDGKVAWSMRNGQLQEERLFRYADMRALFRFIEEYMEQDSEPGRPRTYVIASFDPEDGHILHYTRSVMSKRERQEILVTAFRPSDGQQSSPGKAGQ